MSEYENISQDRVIWITGLSGSGKTTLAKALQKRLPNSILLDGDDLREALGTSQSGFDRESRQKLALAYARIAKLLATQGFTVIVATISLYHAVHDWNRANLPGYLEVFLDVPEEERRRRDPKGLYAREKAGAITAMAGGGTAVEFPLNPDLRPDWQKSCQEMVALILEKIQR